MKFNNKYTILVADDTAEIREVLSIILEPDYEVKVADTGIEALEIANDRDTPDLILLDVMMPRMDGFETCRKLKENEATKDIPVIFLTASTEAKNEETGLTLGAVDYMSKPFSPALLKARVRNHLELKSHRDNLERLVQKRTEELNQTQDATIEAIASLAEYRDPETGGHIRRTQTYVKTLAEYLKDHSNFSDFLNDESILMLYKSAPLHDIGKVGVPDHILLKPGSLTEEEFEEMKKHAIYGRDTLLSAEARLGGNSFLSIARQLTESHHEKWDGSGYPYGLKGGAIPIPGRLMALADVYDALISKRVYKEPFSHEKAIEIICDGKGTHFDPDIVDAFLACSQTFREIAIEFSDYMEERENLIKVANL